MSLIRRIRDTRSGTRSGRQARASSPRCPADPTRSRSRCCCATSRRAVRSSSPASRISTITSAARTPTPMRRSAAPWPTGLVCPRSIGDADVPADARTHQVSIEVAGRHRAPAFLPRGDRVGQGRSHRGRAHARRSGGDRDSAAGARRRASSGLAAMAPRRDHVIRPLLDVTRAELQEFLRARSTRRGARTRPISIARFPATACATRVMPQLRAHQRAGRRCAGPRRRDPARRRRVSRAACQRRVSSAASKQTASRSTVTLDVGGVCEAAGGTGAPRGALCARNRQPVAHRMA